MALMCNIELNSGLAINDAYLRIFSFTGNDECINFSLYIYVNRAAYENEKSPITKKSYEIKFDKERNLYRQMYEYLSELPEYENAVEA